MDEIDRVNHKTYPFECLFKFQFCYCYVSLIFHTDKLYKKYLRIIYNHKKLNFEDLLVKDNSVFIHQKILKRMVQTCEWSLIRYFTGIFTAKRN